MRRVTGPMATGALSAALAALLTLLLALPAAAQSVPTTLNYQGRLLQNTAAQDAITGTVDIVFSIWSGPESDGSAVELWSESWTGVSLSNGIFSVLLGSNGSPLDPADFQGDPSLFLQLEIDGEILLPRQQLGSAPFALVDEPANELQDLELAGTTLSLSDDPTPVDLSGFLDDTDAQDLSNVLSVGNSAGNRNITNVATLTATGLACPDCVDSSDIGPDTIRGNDVNDNIYIVHVECNGECSDMSMREACDVIENLRGLSVHVDLLGVSCVHDIPSTSGNGFVTCDNGTGPVGDNECRAFNLRTLGDIPCIDGDGTDALVTCLETDIAK